MARLTNKQVTELNQILRWLMECETATTLSTTSLAVQKPLNLATGSLATFIHHFSL
jgi:hypothetical protein